MIPGTLLIDDLLVGAMEWRRRVSLLALSVTFPFGVFVTYLGNAVYWDHYIRIETEAVQAWLGPPNNSGDGVSTPGSPCPVCFETLHSLHWVPAFNHIAGNYWLLTHLSKKDTWVVAEKDVPWRRYTSLNVNISQSYARARVDWWFLEYRHLFPTLAWTLMIVLPTLSATFLVLFFLELRRAMLGPNPAPSPRGRRSRMAAPRQSQRCEPCPR